MGKNGPEKGAETGRNTKGQFAPGSGGGPGRGHKKPAIDIPENADNRDIAMLVLREAMSCDDAKLRVRAASLVAKLGDLRPESQSLASWVLKMLQVIKDMCLARDLDVEELMVRMEKTCTGCNKLGALVERGEQFDPDGIDLEKE